MVENALQTSGRDPGWPQQLSGLPQKLGKHLMPFQREGVAFALSKNGRYVVLLERSFSFVTFVQQLSAFTD